MGTVVAVALVLIAVGLWLRTRVSVQTATSDGVQSSVGGRRGKLVRVCTHGSTEVWSDKRVERVDGPTVYFADGSSVNAAKRAIHNIGRGVIKMHGATCTVQVCQVIERPSIVDALRRTLGFKREK